MAPNNSRIIELLKSRNFALLWFGQSISRVGNFVYDAAIGLTVYMLTGSSVDVGIVLATFTIAQLISLLVGGPLVDRLVRKNIILATDCVATCVTAGLAISLAEGHINLLSLCGISACLGVLSAFHLPALRAILPEMVDEEHLHGANAFMGVTNSITRIVGPGLGGFLIATLGPVVTFVVDTLTFVVAVLTMLFTQVRIKKDTRNAPQRASMVSEAIDGIKQVLTENRLRDLMLIGALVNVLVLGPVAVLLDRKSVV